MENENITENIKTENTTAQMSDNSEHSVIEENTSCQNVHGFSNPKLRTMHIMGACLNGIMFIGLVVLYIMFFNSKGSSKHNPNATAPIVSGEGGLTIAYVNTDSLMAKYQYALDLNEEMSQYAKQQENSYKQQITQYQNDYQKYLKEGPDMTLSQQTAKEEELKNRAAKLQTLEAELTMKIQEKTLKESEAMTRCVYNFIRDYNKDNQQFDLILAKSFSSSPILYGNEGMDITNEIIEGLNDEYKAVKAKKEKENK